MGICRIKTYKIVAWVLITVYSTIFFSMNTIGSINYHQKSNYMRSTPSDAQDEGILGTMSNALPCEEDIKSPIYFLPNAGTAEFFGNWSRNTAQVDFKKCYGDQLREVEDHLGLNGIRKSYDIMEENSDKLEIEMGIIDEFESELYHTSDAIKELLQNIYQEYGYKLQIANDAFAYDHPEIFWREQISYEFNTTIKNNSDFSGFIYTVYCNINYITDLSQKEINLMIKEQEHAVEELINMAPQKESRYEYVASLYHVLAETVSYDYSLDAEYSHEAYGALVENEDSDGGHVAVCDGYAKALKVLCDYANIPCTLVIGEGVNESSGVPHMWNYVQMEDNNWYAMDLTWDDMGMGAEYEYFLNGSESIDSVGVRFLESHIENSSFSEGGWSFAYPKLETLAYVPAGIPLEELHLNESSVTLIKGQVKQLKVNKYPENTNYPVFWASGDSGIVRINDGGHIEAVDCGVTLIAVRSPNGILDTCEVTVELSEGDKRDTFVKLLYKKLLGRISNPQETEIWSTRLKEGMNGADIICRIISGKEFTSKYGTDEECIKAVYGLVYVTNETQEGLYECLKYLKAGVSKQFVLKRILEDKSYWQLCKEYGVVPGNVEVTENRDRNYKTTAYVNRCYQVVLSREANRIELNKWTGMLLDGHVGGIDLTVDLIEEMGYEFEQHTKEENIDVLYHSMLGRDADIKGKKDWKQVLDYGVSIKYLINHFGASKEYQRICSEIGITSGTMHLTENRDKNIFITRYVSWNYQTVLGRAADIKGLNDWTGKMVEGKMTPQMLTKAVVFSREALQRNCGDKDFVKMLYQVCLRRAADTQGLHVWCSRLQDGMNREYVLYCFTKTDEYENMLLKYGIK